MEQYLLTQEDIDRLGITGVMAGEPATEEELRALFPAQMNERDQLARQAMLSSMDMPATVGGTVVTPLSMQAESKLPIDESEILPPDVPVAQQITGTTAPVVPSAGEDVGAPLQARGIESLLASVATQPATQEDPYSALSKTQKRMLAFAAISDAGAALQGQQGRAVRDLMGDFTKRADQRRKAQAAQMRQAMLGQVLSGTSGGALNRQAIINAMAMGLIDGPTGTAMLAEDERKQGVSQEIAGKEMMIGQIDALLFDPALGKALGIEGFLRTPFADLGLDTETARVKARIDQIKGGAFLQAFESLKGGGQITELEGQKAEAAQSRLNTAQSEEDFKNALMEYKFYIEQGIRRLNGEQIAPDTLYDQSTSDPLGIR